MSVNYVSGDPLFTRAHTLAFGHNARGRTEMGHLETLLMNRYPAAFSTYTKHCRKGRVQTGSIWFWRESQPYLAFMVVRESSVSATRLRHVQSVVMHLARDFQLEGIRSLALAPLGNWIEWPEIRPIVDYWLGNSPLPVVVYETYMPGVWAEEETLPGS